MELRLELIFWLVVWGIYFSLQIRVCSIDKLYCIADCVFFSLKFLVKMVSFLVLFPVFSTLLNDSEI